MSATIVNGNLRKVVSLPSYVSNDEWIIANSSFWVLILVFEFLHIIQIFWDTISHACKCPSMNCGSGSEILWTDNQKRSLKLSASKYIESAFIWIHSQFEDTSIFPATLGFN